jgi:WD40 repeat protein
MLRIPFFAIATLLSLAVLICMGDDSCGQASSTKDVHGDPLPAGAVARLGTVRWRHGGVTGFVAFLPDGKSVVSASADRVFHVWDFPSGHALRRFGPGATEAAQPPGRSQFPQGIGGLPVALSPDGKVLACNFDLSDILLYEVATGKELAALKQRGDLSTLAFSPDGRHLAVRDVVGQLNIWDWAAAKAVHRRNLAQQIIIEEARTLAWSPDGKLLATIHIAEDANNMLQSSIKLLDAVTAQEVRAIAAVKDSAVTAVVFAPDSKLLAFTTDLDGTIYLADVATGKTLRQIQGNVQDNDTTLAFSRDGKSLFTHSWYGPSVCEWSVATGQKLRDLGPISRPRPLLRAGSDHTLHFVDLPKGKEMPDAGNTTSLAAVGFWPDGKRLWTQESSTILRQWDGGTGKEQSPIILPNSPNKTVISPDGRYAAAEPRGKQAGQIINVATQKKIGTIKPTVPNQRLTHMAFSPDGALLALRWDREQKIDLYEVPSAKLLHSLSIVSGPRPVSRLSNSPVLLFSADGKMLAAFSEPGVLALWDTVSGKRQTKLSFAGSLPVIGGAFTADGRCLALDMSDGTVVVWELATAKERRVFGTTFVPAKGSKLPRPPLNFLAAPLTNVVFAPGGKLLVHGGLDRTIRVWDVQTGQECAAFRGHNGTINALALTADGKTLASASSDTTALI